MKKLLITTPVEWDAWSNQWNSLASPNPMLSHDWLAAWWRSYGTGHQLHILAIEQDGQLLACLPTYLHHTKLGAELRWLGSGKASSDYLSVLMNKQAPGNPIPPLDSLWDLLQESLSQGVVTGWRGIRLQGMSQVDSCVTVLCNRFGMCCQTIGNTWRIELPDTWQSFRDCVKKHHCYRKIKKFEQNLAAGRLSIKMLDKLEDVSFGLETLVTLHQLRRQVLGEQGCFDDQRFTQFLKQATQRMVSRGAARFLLCLANDRPIGIQLQLLGTDGVFIYQSGMDPCAMKWEPGHALVASSLKTAIEQGCRAYDFLRGEEAYKAFWSAKPIPLLSLCGSVDSWKSRSLASIEKRLQWLKMLGKPLSQVSGKLP